MMQAEHSKTIEKVTQQICEHYQPEKIILFGSFAYGKPDADSDLDLLIIKETSERFLDRWVAVRQILSDATRRIPLEVLVLTPEELAKKVKSGDQFIEEILTKGAVLYEA